MSTPPPGGKRRDHPHGPVGIDFCAGAPRRERHHQRDDRCAHRFLPAAWCGARLGKGSAIYSILMLRVRTTRPHFSVSTLKAVARMSGPPSITSMPWLARRSRVSGAWTARCVLRRTSLATISFGVRDRREQREVGRRLEARQAGFVDRRHVGHHRGALAGAGAERAQLAVLDERQRGDDGRRTTAGSRPRRPPGPTARRLCRARAAS